MGKIVTNSGSRSNSNLERLNISLKENKRDVVDSNSNGFKYCVQQNQVFEALAFKVLVFDFLKFLILKTFTAVFIKVATSTLHLGHVIPSKIAFRSYDTAFISCD